MADLSGPYLARAIADTTTTAYSSGRETAHPPSTKLKPVCNERCTRWRDNGLMVRWLVLVRMILRFCIMCGRRT